MGSPIVVSLTWMFLSLPLPLSLKSINISVFLNGEFYSNSQRYQYLILVMNRKTRQKINNEAESLAGIPGTSRTLHPATVQNTFSSSMHRACSRVGHVLHHGTNVKKLKRIVIL